MANEVEVTATESSRKKKVMVAIDDSVFSEHALSWALENLGSDSELIIYTVQPPVDSSYMHASSWGPADLIKELLESERKQALTLLEKAKSTCIKYGVTAEVLTEVGDPKVAICKAVEKLNIELLVVGSHGRGAFQSKFLGSVSNYCVHHAKCPVAVVRKIR